MPTIHADDRSVYVQFGNGPFTVLNDDGTVDERWTPGGEEYASPREQERIADDYYGDAHDAGRDYGYDEGYDAAMEKMYELLADIPDAIAILDKN